MITVSYYTNKKNFVILQDPMYVRKINVFFYYLNASFIPHNVYD